VTAVTPVHPRHRWFPERVGADIRVGVSYVPVGGAYDAPLWPVGNDGDPRKQTKRGR
jgi:hypothetical protein